MDPRPGLAWSEGEANRDTEADRSESPSSSSAASPAPPAAAAAAPPPARRLPLRGAEPGSAQLTGGGGVERPLPARADRRPLLPAFARERMRIELDDMEAEGAAAAAAAEEEEAAAAAASWGDADGEIAAGGDTTDEGGSRTLGDDEEEEEGCCCCCCCCCAAGVRIVALAAA